MGGMAVEIEAKIKVERLAGLAEELRRLGGEKCGDFRERDHFFDLPDRSLRARDCGLRVRESRGEGGVTVKMCYKGPRRTALYKEREEIEVAVGELEAARQFLGALGYGEMLVVEKQREQWRLEQCMVCLDEVEHLGSFVEIEGPDEAAVSRVRALMRLEGAPLVPRSYASMVDGYFRGERGATKSC
jgi:predicted adenylyl cyclase CyaB